MDFKDRLRDLRKKKKLTQSQAAEYLDVSVRTYKNYELGNCLPRYRKIYEQLADLYDVDINYLLVEDDFLLEVKDKYGYRGLKQAKELLNRMSALFAGGELSESDKDVVIKQMKEIFHDAKKENVKFSSKKKEQTLD